MDKDKDTGLSRLDTAKHEACFSTVLAKEQEARRVRLWSVQLAASYAAEICTRSLAVQAESGNRVLCTYAAMHACLELSMCRGQ